MDARKNLDKPLNVILCNQRQCWEQGLGSQVMVQMGRNDLALLFVRDSLVRRLPDGRPAMVDGTLANVDTASFADVLIMAEEITGDPLYRTAKQQLTDWLLKRAPRTSDGILYQLTDRPQIWADSMYFLPAGLIRLGYPDLALQQFRGIHQRLWNNQACLYSHMWDEENQCMIRPDFWASGNGWAAAGIARMIELLPASKPADRNWLIQHQQTLLMSMISYLRPDGLFYDVLNQTETFVETCSVAMTAYAILKGLTGGYLNSALLAQVKRMRDAVNTQVDQYGVVQNACSSPSFDRSGTSTEAQCFYIMMELAAQTALSSDTIA